jgi:ABC-type branched-subunit amino acid transport system substrate-binding protein
MAIGLIGASMLAAACSSSGSASSGSSTSGSSGASGSGSIAIDAVEPLTGAFAQYGQGQTAGLKAVVALVNQQGGVMGRKLVLYVVDDQSDTGKAAAAAQQVMAAHPSPVLFAGATTAEALAITPETTAAKVVTWESSTNPETTDTAKYPYSYNTFPDAQLSVVAYIAALKQKNVTKLAVIYGNDAGQSPLGLASISAAKAAGIDVVSSSAVDQTATSFTSQLEAAKSAGAQCVLLLINIPTTYTTFFQNFVNIGWTSPLILMTPSAANSTVLGSVPSELHNVSVVTERSSLKTSDETALLKEIVSYTASSGGGSLLSAANMGDALSVTVWAMRTTKSTDALKLVSLLNGLGNTSIPASVLSGGGFPDPHFTATVHSLANGNMSNSWAIITPGAPVDGQYPGVTLQLTSG